MSEVENSQFVWVPHPQSIWRKARLHEKVSLTEMQVAYLDDDSEEDDTSQFHQVNIPEVAQLAGEMSDSALPICNTFERLGVEDMCTLNHLHEPAILENLSLRFRANLPYTYTGQICIAVNPYKWLNELYGKELYQKYLTQPRDSLDPHPYSLSAHSYNDMMENSNEQSILVSGESGAGKTETVKIMMNYLASVSGGGEHGSLVIDKILKSNPLLESFGNAKTKRNDNSSRFGKFAQLQFDKAGFLVGARCETYLLEKSRIVGQAEGERNYHIFYQILSVDDEERQKFRLAHKSVKDYTITKAGDFTTIDGEDDAQLFQGTKDAMTTIGIDENEQNEIFRIVSAILNLGEVEYIERKEDDEHSHAEVSNINLVEDIAHLLKTDVEELKSSLCKRAMTAGTESYSIPLNYEQAVDLRDAFAKGIYSLMFKWLVGRINRSICSPSAKVKSHIGLLDIFGFESFDKNGFEQFCINYANEKLQQKFNSDVFKTVQAEYIQEEIPLTLVSFQDNQPILDLIEGRMGIVNLLNEEVLRPGATDAAFVSKVLDTHGNHDNLQKIKFQQMKFLVQHYAGDVTYDGNGFLEKNKDTLPTDLVSLLSSSSSSFISEMFTLNTMKAKRKSSTSGSRGRHKGYLVGNTIAGEFRKQLSELMATIGKTSVQYVRCIKPNSNKSSTEYDRKIIVEQLRCAGVISAIRISRAAFPNRLSLGEFQKRFKTICPYHLKDSGPKEMVMGLLREMLPEEDTQEEQNTKFAIGKSKVYFSSGLLQLLEDQRNRILRNYGIKIQRNIRRYVSQRKYQILRRGVISAQAQSRCRQARLKFVKKRFQYILIQSLFRGVIARKRCIGLRFAASEAAKVAQLAKEEEERNAAAAALAAVEGSKLTIDEAAEPVAEPYGVSGADRSSVKYVDSMPSADALTSAAAKVAEAEAAAREAQNAASAAASYNRELQQENENLKIKLSSNIAEFADSELLRENEHLKKQIQLLQSKLMRAQEVSLISAKVVDSRITSREGKQFVEYKLQIETNTRGTLYVWHRYSTFRNLAATLQSKNGYKRKDIPELPSKQLFGNFSGKVIQDRVERLNQFLEAATNADYLQWGIRVDQETCVYKRRVKSTYNSSSRESYVSTSSTANTANSSPITRQSSSKTGKFFGRLSMVGS